MATTSMADQASIAETVAPTVAAKACATRRAVPSGTKVAVASAISLFCRAASPAPRKPTHKVRCWTKGMEPGMPPVTIGRTTISASGRSAIAASAPAATNSSVRWRNASTGATRRATAAGNVFIRTSSSTLGRRRARSPPWRPPAAPATHDRPADPSRSSLVSQQGRLPAPNAHRLVPHRFPELSKTLSRSDQAPGQRSCGRGSRTRNYAAPAPSGRETNGSVP